MVQASYISITDYKLQVTAIYYLFFIFIALQKHSWLLTFNLVAIYPSHHIFNCTFAFDRLCNLACTDTIIALVLR